MYYTRNMTSDIVFVGGNDRRLALFESNFPIPRGVSYNSYLLLDEKTVLLDTADAAIGARFFDNIDHALGGRELDYLVIHHMEPDHAALVEELLRRYPEVKIIGNIKTMGLLEQFYGVAPGDRAVVVKEGDTISFGKHSLTFYMAPMVHWPEAMVSYDSYSKALFSADAFGTFGALDGAVFADEFSFDSHWLDDARRYYTNICGKYGPQVQALLKKASMLDISMICPLHGPVWRKDLGYFIDLYDKWSTYTPEDREVVVFYGSMYNNTLNAVEVLSSMLVEKGVRVKAYDVASTHVSELISEAFRVSHIVLAAPTYNNGLYPQMAALLHDMKALNVQKRTVAVIENGSWAPQAGKIMREELSGMKEMTVMPESVTLKSSLRKEQRSELQAIADAVAASINK
ncbi:MAG: FprA family A-type flavoprotein [Clostridia bacterium]|nr:FprA family A-type flavoprotein [Clostridia bacterium]